MSEDLNMEDYGLENEADFEASLISDLDSETSSAETDIIRPPEPRGAPQAGVSARQQPAWAGKILGHFKLLRPMGKGTMGCVIQALDVNLQRIVALKVLRKRLAGVDEQQKVNQFLREARVAAKIEHPNVVRIYEINQHDGWWYIAMEMVQGEDLGTVVKAVGSLPVPSACTLIADAATALSVAHNLGIIHRDIKPTNLMLTRDGRCKLTDFGLVRVDDPNDPFDFTDKAVGSPQFIAPEMIRRQRQTAAIDIYSLGATLYYAMVGRPPYTGRKLEDILKQHLEAPPPDLRERLPECPVTLAILLRRAMAKQPAERPTAAELAASLRAQSIVGQPDDSGVLKHPGSTVMIPALKSRASPTAAARAGSRRLTFGEFIKSRWYMALGAVAVLVFGLLLLNSLLPGTDEPTSSPAGAGLAKRFPDAPESYGVLGPNAIAPTAPARAEPPPFSWVGKVDAAGYRFVASERGRHFYPIDSPMGVLISAEDFVGYKTAEDARADGKVSAP